MNWKQYFTNTIISRGYNYYRRGCVENVERIDEVYHADVMGAVPYQVEIWEKPNHQLGMSCTCPYAKEGNKCKHMAAVCYELEEELKGNDLTPVAPQKPRKVDEQVYPFSKKNMPGEKEYTCFDLSVMTRNIKIMNSQLEAAKALIEKGEIRLESVGEGYAEMFYGKSVPAGEVTAKCKDRSGEALVHIRYTEQNLLEANCRVWSCYHYYNSAYYSEKKICKHQLAALLLLKDYIDKYNPGNTTGLEVLQMMDRYQKQYRSQAIEAEIADLQIEPRLEQADYGLEVSFRVGTQKLYVVKSLDEFVENVEGNRTQRFGTKTEINFGIHKVSPAARKYYDFIKKVVRGEQLRAEADYHSYYDEVKVGGKIQLYGSRLDEMFEIMLLGGVPIPYLDKFSGRKNETITAKEKTPEIELTLSGNYERKVFKGIKVSGMLPETLKGEQYLYYIEDSCLYRMDADRANVLSPLLDMGMDGRVEFEVGRKSLADFYYHTMPVLSEHVNFVDNIGEDIEEYLPPQAAFKFYLDEEKGELTCEVKAVYGEEEISLMDHFAQEPMMTSLRDTYAEKEALACVTRYCPEIDRERGAFLCAGDEAICAVLENGINEWMTMGEVLCTDRVKRINLRKKTQMSVGVSLESGIMELEISSDGISPKELLEILASYRKKKKYHRLVNGDFINTEDENLSMLASMLDTLQVPAKEFLKGKIQIPAYRALYLDKVLEKNESLYVERDKHFKTLIKEFKTMEDSDYEVPDSLQKVMRPYQTIGFKWLKTLEAYGFGGILADDMGLGKTLQVISVLLQAKEEKKEGTSLIVSPASLIYNWQEEFHRFAPKLSTLVINGGQAERKALLEQYAKYDVVITSYDLLKRDVAEYEDKAFLYQVIDEAQYIKNHTTMVAKAVKCIHSKTKYALTGTPIENRLSELWSIFDYLMPGFLYGYETFRKELETPIAKNKDEDASKRLKRMVAPFILRRLKQDVLKDLPEKLEEVQYARFAEKQQQLYDGQVVHMKGILAKQSSEEFSQSKIQILAELMKLREICCDPALLFEDFDGESAKRIMCVDLVKRAIEGEHRILIFSQFTSMLSLLEQELEREKIAFYKITGATKKEERIRLVKQFNEGDVPVFLISLKAGGTGLNLVGADTVIHYDPWWNQAVQNQATDRAHRIGQKRIVTVYKLIVKDSIEEKILKMQENKKNLADEILSGENGGLAQLSKEELLELLEG